MADPADFYVDTPLRLFAELTVEKTLAGRYMVETQRRTEVNGVELAPPRIVVLDITPEEGAAILASDAAGKAAEVQALHAQVGVLQEQVADQAKKLEQAKAALLAVAGADHAWDASPRAEVSAALQALA